MALATAFRLRSRLSGSSSRPYVSLPRPSVCVRAAAKDDLPKSKGKLALVAQIAKETGLSKEKAGDAFDSIIGQITEAVASGERVTIVGFGTFESRDRAARTGRNPKTGAVIDIAASKAAVFKASAAFKDKVNGREAPPPRPVAAKPVVAKAPRPAKPAPPAPAAAKKAATKK